MKAQGRPNKRHSQRKGGYNGKYNKGGKRLTGARPLGQCRLN